MLVGDLVETTGRPAAAYATDKSGLILTEQNQEIADPEAVEEWHDAYDEFEDMTPEEQETWVAKVLITYPRMDDMPDPEGYNEIH